MTSFPPAGLALKDARLLLVYVGHLIHLIMDEPDGVRMRSRFWLGDVDGITDPEIRRANVPENLAMGLLQHATEEMAI